MESVARGKPLSKKITFVTAFFDLKRREQSERSSKLIYFGLFRWLARIKHPLVIYIEKENKQDLDKILKNLSPSESKRKIVTIEIEELPLYKYNEQFKNLNIFRGGSSFKDTHLFGLITLCKPSLVAKIAEENPFETKYFSWIDFGISYVIDKSTSDLDEIVETTPEKIRLLMIQPTRFTDRTRNSFYPIRCDNIAGGFFSGSKSNIIKFSNDFETEMKEMIKTGFLGSEQHIFTYLAFNDRKNYEFLFGDYYSIISHGKSIKRDITSVVNCLKMCRHFGYTDLGYQIYCKIRDGLNNGILISKEYAVQILYDGFICSYYINKEEAIKIANVVCYLNKFPNLNLIIAKYDLFDHNLAFVNKKLSNSDITNKEAMTGENNLIDIWWPILK